MPFSLASITLPHHEFARFHKYRHAARNDIVQGRRREWTFKGWGPLADARGKEALAI
jgi:hypothetical protein